MHPIIQNLHLTEPLAVFASGLVGALAVVVAGIFSNRVVNKSAEISKLQINLSLQSKIAEFRQAWIDNLRDAMSEFQSFGATPGVDHFKEREFYRSGTKIELLMNPGDEDFCELQRVMYEYRAACTDEEKDSVNAIFVEVCQRILKREWDRLKSELTVIEKKMGHKGS